MGRFDPTATIAHEYVPTFEDPYVEYAFIAAKVIFAMSPLIFLGWVIFTGFESKEDEDKKRKEKCDSKCC